MTDREPDPPQAPSLTLPPAVLNAPQRAPHPDSEEFLQCDRHRTAQELDTIHEGHASASHANGASSPRAPQALRSPTMHSSGRRSLSYREGGLRRRPSEVSTVPDVLGPDEYKERRYRLRRQVAHWYDPIVKFWTTQVNVTIDEGAHRDHLALERTFLGYLRTSLALAMTGIVTAQLFRLQHSINPNPNIGYFVLGIPLAASFIGSGMVVLLVGAFRFWQQQNAMIRGKVHAGGWEITGIMVLGVLLSVATFALVTAVDVEKTYV